MRATHSSISSLRAAVRRAASVHGGSTTRGLGGLAARSGRTSALRAAAPPRWTATARFCAAAAPEPSSAALYEEAVRLIETDGDDDALAHARLLLERAAAAGLPAAQGRLGRWHMFAIGGAERDGRRALELLHPAAVAGDSTAQYWLGRLFLAGDEFRREEDMPTSCGSSGGADAAADGSSAPAEGMCACGKKAGSCGSSPSSSSSSSSTSIPAGFGEADATAAKAVLADIRAMRRHNRTLRATVSGAPATPTSAASAPATLAARRLPPLQTDRREAEFWLAEAARRDHVDAQVAMGNLCMEHEPRPRVREAIAWYRVAAESDHADAWFNLGTLARDGVEGLLAPDPAEAHKAFHRAAELGDVAALFWLGHAYRVGDATAAIPQSGAKAMEYLHRAAERGHPGAQHYVAQLYRTGDPAIGLAPNPILVWHFLRLAEANEHPPALFELGDTFVRGLDGVAVDLPRALRYFEHAGMLGHTDALCSAGAMYAKGMGTEPDLPRAFALYQRAADMGHLAAWENVAVMLAMGEGVPKDEAAAKHIREHVLPTLRAAAAQDAELDAELDRTDTRDASSADDGADDGAGNEGGLSAGARESKTQTRV